MSQEIPTGKISLFDGTNIGQWITTDFTGHGDVYIKDNSLILQQGERLTGVTWTGDVPTNNYQINLDAMRLDGTDFFCGLTFPFDDTFLTFVVGGWNGVVCGISSIDHFDASDNETTVKTYLENNRWFHIRVLVTPGRIQCWIDKKQYVDLETEGKHLGIRRDVRESTPLGIASFRCTSSIKNITLTKL
jgi:hypothetical protein